ncbi:MAG: 3-hydroxybutyryl-CoA dehydrogenase [Planctomycetota bacterium]
MTEQLPKKVAVVGAGTMGNGIAQAFASVGVGVSLIDVKDEFVQRGLGAVQASLARFVKKGTLAQADADAVAGRIQGATAMDAAADAQLVIEAVSESEELKRRVFGQLDSVCAATTILASNTSSISITRIGAATKRAPQVIGMHFMNPVPLMKLVEVVRGQDTSDATTELVVGWAKAMGKVPVPAQDYPGFISNRVLMPMINEAVFCLMEGVSSREGIDEIMKLGMNHPMGPLQLADFIGLDVCLSILDVLKDGLGDDKYRACPLLRRMVAAGHLGKKTGKGFYDYKTS